MDTTLTSFIWVRITHLAGAARGQDSPFNVMNWLLEVLILSPALVALCIKRRAPICSCGARSVPPELGGSPLLTHRLRLHIL